MRFVAWMLVVLIAAGLVYVIRRAYMQWNERSRAAEERMATLLAQAKAAGPQTASAAPLQEAAQERLLFDAAAKTAQAGEPALAIQLYARLLSRFPQTAFAMQARAAVAEQKARLAKA